MNRTYDIRHGTLYMFRLTAHKNHSKWNYHYKTVKHVSRWPDWALKLRGAIWKMLAL